MSRTYLLNRIGQAYLAPGMTAMKLAAILAANGIISNDDRDAVSDSQLMAVVEGIKLKVNQ